MPKENSVRDGMAVTRGALMYVKLALRLNGALSFDLLFSAADVKAEVLSSTRIKGILSP